ncbi:MAG: S41 family peptidase [bacterium]
MKKIVFIIFLILCLSFNLFSQQSPKKYLDSYQQILYLLKQNYVDESKIDYKVLINDSIAGMLKSLDPYTEFLDEELYKEFSIQTEGKYGGLGIIITLRDEILTIISCFDGSPAAKAGILSGDQIVEIEGVSTKVIKLSEAVKKMRGDPNTKVNISIYRNGFKDFLKFTLTRAIIQLKSIPVAYFVDKEIFYIKLVDFQKNADKDLKQILDKAEKQKAKGIILDLRNNGGGLLDQAIKISEIFLDYNKEIVSTRTKEKNNNDVIYSSNYNPYNKPVVILINQGTASASEIVAGALKHHGKAILMGKKSFGKGSVQSIVNLTENTALKLTIAKYYLPSGECIDGKGINPDIEVKEKQYSQLIYHFMRKDYFRKFAENFVLKNKKIDEKIEITEDMFEQFIDIVKKDNFDFVKELVTNEDLIDILKEKNIDLFSEFLTKNKLEICKLLKTNILMIAEGEETSSKYFIKWDINVQEAIKYLKEKISK